MRWAEPKVKGTFIKMVDSHSKYLAGPARAFGCDPKSGNVAAKQRSALCFRDCGHQTLYCGRHPSGFLPGSFAACVQREAQESRAGKQ